jgi:hypothetical protein
MPSVNLTKSCLAVATRAFLAASSCACDGAGAGPAGPAARPWAPGGAAGGGVGTGSWINSSPLKPEDVGPLSCAGISSLRTYLSGSSTAISNSIGTRLSPRTWRVRPVATKFLTPLSRFSPPSASRAAARIGAGSRPGTCVVGVTGCKTTQPKVPVNRTCANARITVHLPVPCGQTLI